MMGAFRCNSCLGEYDDVLADGTEYYHACAPVPRVSVERGGVPLVVDLPAVLPTDTVLVLRVRARVWTLVSDLQPDDVRLNDVAAPRAQARDETVVGPPPAPGQRSRIRAAGRGRTAI